ncbi:AMP-binding protein [Streptomyces sp. NPDC059949]|uniref:AMP-binding protein n=1 Tax=Streptomyces sp. NPDC059949 TaxID=3347013 RepID=UPI0036512208
MTQGSESVRFGKPTTDTAVHRFEQWARDTPGASAVIAGAASLTYGQLDARANQLAHHLLDAGLPADGLVAIGTHRQAELVVAVLAALKAGGTYTVLDVDAPRTGQQQLAAAPPFVLLTHAAHQARLDDGRGLRVIRLGGAAAVIAERPTVPPTPSRRGVTAALVFTGGAVTRAVPVSHARLLAAHDSWAEVLRPTPEDRHLITTGPSLTAFAAGWTRALCSGGALVVAESAPWKPDTIRQAIDADQVSVVHTDPVGAARLLLPGPGPRATAPGVIPKPLTGADPGTGAGGAGGTGGGGGKGAELHALRLVAVTGGRLYLDEQAALQSRLRTGVRLLNVYGTTETAGTGAWFELAQLPRPVDDPEPLSLIGTPFPGCRVDLRDGQVYLTPADGGDAIPTGDLAALRGDGLLAFGGRLRDRITLDGRTIDPHRLESVIRGHEGVGAAIVAAVPGFAAVSRLVAYLAPPAGEPGWPPGSGLPDIDELRDFLADKVPAEERPRAVVRLRTLPRTRGGREDREALPRPAQAVSGHTVRGAGKYAGAADTGPGAVSAVIGCGALVLGFVARVLTWIIWPGSTDVTGIPLPWAFLFQVLYMFECVAFGLGVLFLFSGRRRMLGMGHGRRLTTAAHLSIVYLLVAWWPQDNFYRLAAKQDWPQQAALVYVFNIPLMIAAAIVAYFATRNQSHLFDADD